MRAGDRYVPIQDYAAIGDGRTVALVARDGSIDWLALPRLDSRTVFARLVDAERGGAFELSPTEPFEVERAYVGDSNVLRTTFTTRSGTVVVTDAVTLDNGGLLPWFELARRVEGATGRVPMEWKVTPRFGAGEDESEMTIRSVRGAIVAEADNRYVSLQTFDAGDANHTTEHIRGTFETTEGSEAFLVLRSAHEEPLPVARRDWIARRVDSTADDWQRWLADAGVEGPWRDATRRSSLALRLLTYVPTGAIAAAATTSLPEKIGADKNYDYRYSWVRDTAYTLDALLNTGLLVQVHSSFAWLLDAVGQTEPEVHVFYDLDGETTKGEKELDLAGYRDSRPVRRGNQAAGQLQLSSYGDLLETAELYVGEGNILDAATAERLEAIVDRLCSIWERKDSGIWELQQTEHYTSSKLTAWTAIDRALRLVDEDQLPDDHADTWRAKRNDIRDFVERECWSDSRATYVMHPGTEKLDASVLRVCRMGYLDARGRQMNGTIDAIREELHADGPLIFRYSGQQDAEGAFVACSFWLVEALARAGRIDEATALMDDLVALANDVGLYSEEIDPTTHDFLGNVPQGLSHLSLITAAAAIAEETRGGSQRD